LGCVLNYVVLTASCVLALLCLYTLIVMCISLGRIKFENYVILSGIVELSVILVILIIRNEYLIQLIEFLQLIIILFIARRFFKCNTSPLRNSDQQIPSCYNIFFVVFVILNLIFMSLTIFFVLTRNYEHEEDDERTRIIQISHHCFSLISSLILLKIGITLKSLLTNVHVCHSQVFKVKLFEENVTDKEEKEASLLNILEKEQQSEHHKHGKLNEYTNEIRIQQINIVCYTFLLTGLYKCVYIVMKYYLLDHQFNLHNGKTLPKTLLTTLLHFFYLMSIIVPIITNYIAFYFIIRNYFRGSNELPTESRIGLTASDINRNTTGTKNTKADEYFN